MRALVHGDCGDASRGGPGSLVRPLLKGLRGSQPLVGQIVMQSLQHSSRTNIARCDGYVWSKKMQRQVSYPGRTCD
jgi:hypothetical protein